MVATIPEDARSLIRLRSKTSTDSLPEEYVTPKKRGVPKSTDTPTSSPSSKRAAFLRWHWMVLESKSFLEKWDGMMSAKQSSDAWPVLRLRRTYTDLSAPWLKLSSETLTEYEQDCSRLNIIHVRLEEDHPSRHGIILNTHPDLDLFKVQSQAPPVVATSADRRQYRAPWWKSDLGNSWATHFGKGLLGWINIFFLAFGTRDLGLYF